MMLRRAIERYHELLTPDVAAESQALLDEQLLSRGLFFGDRALCSVLRPRLLFGEHFAFVQRQCALLLAAFARALRAALADGAVLDQFGLEDWERTLIEFDPGFRDASPTSRLDAFYDADAGSLYFTEYNAETPAGRATTTCSPRSFFGAAGDGRVPARSTRCARCRRATTCCTRCSTPSRSWRGTRDQPRIAILDWREVPTYSEFVLFAGVLPLAGRARASSPTRARWSIATASCCVGDFQITLIYKRVLISELVERGGMRPPGDARGARPRGRAW